MRVAFRFKPEGDKAWVGFAEGHTWEDIFDNIDQYGDPCSADVIRIPKARQMSFCIPYEYNSQEDWWERAETREIDEICGEFSEFEPDSDIWKINDTAWKKFLGFSE